MPNTQTSVPAFTAGQVLTAAQMTEVNTGIPVFATTTTRDAAFGGTGEKTLAEGQFAYIEASNTTQYYDGAAWQTVGLTPGLQYVTGGSFTTATSFSLAQGSFSSTYRNYRLIVTLSALTADATFTMRMRASGSDNTNNNYNYALSSLGTAGTTSNSFAGGSSSWAVGESDTGTVRYDLVFDIMNPQLALSTNCLGFYAYVPQAPTDVFARYGYLQFSATTQFDSLSFISSVASSMTGIYRVYGYSES